jgi:hypothetical protein
MGPLTFRIFVLNLVITVCTVLVLRTLNRMSWPVTVQTALVLYGLLVLADLAVVIWGSDPGL